MSYSYPIDAQAMFKDRTHQFVGFGLPATDVERVRAATTDFWADAPGGWPYEFSRLAADYTADHRVPVGVAGLRLREVPVPGRRGPPHSPNPPAGAVPAGRTVVSRPVRAPGADPDRRCGRRRAAGASVQHRRTAAGSSGVDLQRRCGHLEDGCAPVVHHPRAAHRRDRAGLRHAGHRREPGAARAGRRRAGPRAGDRGPWYRQRPGRPPGHLVRRQLLGDDGADRCRRRRGRARRTRRHGVPVGEPAAAALRHGRHRRQCHGFRPPNHRRRAVRGRCAAEPGRPAADR